MTEHHPTIVDVRHGGCALFRAIHNGVLWTVMIDCGHKNNDRGQWFPGDYSFKAAGDRRWVLTTRTDGNIDFKPSYPAMFVY